MRVDRSTVSGVPTLVYQPDGASGLLLLGHGGGHGKDSERFVALSTRYAEATGLAVVCIDAIDHGDRRPAVVVGDGPPPGWHSRSIDPMVADWQAVSLALEAIGPPVGYIGFSMGAIFGVPTVAAMPTIRAAVFAAGGIPDERWVDDPPLRARLLDAASRITSAHVLFTHPRDDEVFSDDDARVLFEAIGTAEKRYVEWDGAHDVWPDDAIRESAAFLVAHTA